MSSAVAEAAAPTDAPAVSRLRLVLDDALAVVIRGSSRRQGKLIKAAKEARADLAALPDGDIPPFLTTQAPAPATSPPTASPSKPLPQEEALCEEQAPEGGEAIPAPASDEGVEGSEGRDAPEEEGAATKEGAEAASPARPDPASDAQGAVAAGRALCVLGDALLSRQAKVIDGVLGYVYVLIAEGLVRGACDTLCLDAKDAPTQPAPSPSPSPSSSSPSSTNPVGWLLETASRSHDVGDEGVERKLLKTLLAMVLSPAAGVHGESLLLVIRTCYHVYLGSRSDVVHLLAKAVLIQITLALMDAMEGGVGGADGGGEGFTCIVVSDIVPSPTAQAQAQGNKKESADAAVQTILNDVAADVADLAPLTHNAAGGIGLGVAAADATLALGGAGGGGAKGGEEEPLDKQASGKSFDPSAFALEDEEAPPLMALTIRKDVFLIFRALCKLSMKANSEGDPFAIRGKMLSLELIKVLLQNAGPTFRTHERFVDAVKQYLCLSLLKNCASNVPAAFQMSASIFQTLAEKFRASLKAQFGVFFPMIFLRPFETPGFHMGKGSIGTYEVYSQWVVLFRCLYSMCCDKQILSDIFVNYDCDLAESNLFERLVAGLVGLVQGALHMEGSGFTATMDFNLKFFAMQCLIGILKCLSADDANGDDKRGEKDENDDECESVNGDERERVNGAEREGDDPSTVDQLEQRKAYKKEFQKAVLQFNKKPRKGIQFMQKCKMVGDQPCDVAEFLMSTKALDKGSIGEYLGEADEYSLQVMYAYVDMLDFAGMSYVGGIRHFLKGFRLPGEAQKIDRLMEKFAERYCLCNPEAFLSADVAYVLAYSVILLNTDAHNPQIKAKDKMTLEGFLKNNRGINDGKDLPEEFLSAVYNSIVTNEIKMTGGAEDMGKEVPLKPKQTTGVAGIDVIINIFGGNQVRPVEIDDAVIRETHKNMKEEGEEMKWTTAVGSEDIRPMLESAWAPILGAVSIAFEETDDESIVSLCLDAFYYVVKIASPLGMDIVRDAFLSSLAKATHLHMPVQVQAKRGEAFKTLLRVALDSGNHLSAGWKTVLTTISQFERMNQNRNLDSLTDEKIFATPSPKKQQKATPQRGFKRTSATPVQQTREASVFDPSCAKDIELLFESSGKLSSGVIVQFVQALCQVSSQELESVDSPRIFSLTKIVEVAHYNMDRVRIVWSRIWSLLADYFIFVGCHQNLNVAMYAIDALRQLAMKFLERDELANYTFQNDFLKPFVTVMRQSKAVEIRELIIRCVSQFILARVGNVKSGWKSMFMVFTEAASDENKQVVALAFQTIEKIVREYFFHVTETETATFTDCVNCLIAFANSPLSTVSLNAIAFLRFSALKLAEGELGELEAPVEALKNMSIHADSDDGGTGIGTGPGSPPKGSPLEKKGSSRHAQLFTDKDVHLYFWFPLLAGLSELTFDTREEIRHSSLEVLFDILDYHGGSFSLDFWNRIFHSVLFPIFDHVRAEVTEIDTFVKEADRPKVDAWLYETVTASLQHVVDLFAKFFSELRDLLPQLVSFVCGFAVRNHENLASTGVAALFRLLLSIGDKMNEREMETTLQAVAAAIADTKPCIASLLDGLEGLPQGAGNADTMRAKSTTRSRAVSLSEGSGARKLTHTHCKISVQVLLAQCIGKFYENFASSMSASNKQATLEMLRMLVQESRSIDLDMAMRRRLAELQIATQVATSHKLPDPPLLELEKQSFGILLKVVLDMTGGESVSGTQGGGTTGDADSSPRGDGLLNDGVVALCLDEVETFLRVSESDGPAECDHRQQILEHALGAIMALPEKLFRAHAARIFQDLSDLIKCVHATPATLRAVSAIFSNRFLSLLPTHPADE